MTHARKITTIMAMAAAVAAMFGLSACGRSASAKSAAAPPVPTIQVDVLTGKLSTKFNILGPDRRGHDTFVPSEFTAKAGQTYKMVVYNYDEGAHTMTFAGLGISETIAPHTSDDQPSVTTFTITFPRTGTFRFYCTLPCDAGQGGWAMTKDAKGAGQSQDGFMAGYVNVIA